MSRSVLVHDVSRPTAFDFSFLRVLIMVYFSPIISLQALSCRLCCFWIFFQNNSCCKKISFEIPVLNYWYERIIFCSRSDCWLVSITWIIFTDSVPFGLAILFHLSFSSSCALFFLKITVEIFYIHSSYLLSSLPNKYLISKSGKNVSWIRMFNRKRNTLTKSLSDSVEKNINDKQKRLLRAQGIK